jgi:putative ABC transport system permease protein
VLRLLRLISYPQLRASWGRTALVVGGIATGVSLIVAINVINTSVIANLRRTVDFVAGPAQLEVTLGLGEVGFDEHVATTVRADPEVQTVIPLVRGTIGLADDPGHTLQLYGADLVAEEDLQRYTITTTTDRRQLLRVMEDQRALLVTDGFAAARGLAVGSSLVVTTPTGKQTLTIRGLLAASGFATALGGQLAVMDLPSAQALLGKRGRVDQIDVVLRPDADVPSVAARLRAALPGVLTVDRPAQRGADYERVFASFRAMLTGISTLCLIAGVYIIYNTTATGAVQRAAALAILQCCGGAPSQLFTLLMMEALLLGIAGTIFGFFSGLIQGWLLSGMVSSSMSVIFKMPFFVERLALDWRQLAVIAVLGVASSLLASYSASRQVTRLDPIEILRNGARLAGLQSRPRRLLLWWVLLVSIAVAALVAQEHTQSIFWGNVSAAVWNASIIIVAVPVTAWCLGWSRMLWSRVFPAEGSVALANLADSTTRTGVTVAAIALVLATQIVLTSLSHSFRDSAGTYIEKLLSADLVVSAVTTEGGYLETPIPDGLVDEIARLPGVRTVESVRAIAGQIFHGQRIGLLALSDGFFGTTGGYPAGWYKEGDPDSAGAAIRAGRGVNVSNALSDRFGVHLNDEITLDTPTGPVKVPVVGVVPDFISDRGSVILGKRFLAEHWNERTATRINVFLAPGAGLEDVRARIEQTLGDRYALKILTLGEVLEYHDAYRRQAFAFTDAVQLLIIIVTVAGILDLLLSGIMERRREFAVWRLIGADENAVRRSVVIESATVGALGALLSGAVAWVTAWIWIRFNFRHLLGYYLEFTFPLGAALWYVLLAMIVTMITGRIASRYATRAPILEGLRIE